MNRYYYLTNDKEIGPLTLEQLKDYKIKKATLIRLESSSEYIPAENIDELKLMLGNNIKPTQKNFLNNINAYIRSIFSSSVQSKKIKLDQTDLSITHPISLLIIGFIFNLIFSVILGSKDVIAYVIAIVLRIIIALYVVSFIYKQNRGSLFWGIIAFIFPIIALFLVRILGKRPIENSLAISDL
jgi:hypothetical protein